MKIKIIDKSYDEVMKIKRAKHKRPRKPTPFFRALVRIAARGDLKKTHFKFERIGMERLGRTEPALFLMNHSSFIDLEIVPTILKGRPYNIVATSDAFIGKKKLMQLIGCISTNKFVSDSMLVRDMLHAVKTQKSSVVLFPEAGYTFDGTAMLLPDTIPRLVKMLGVPLIMIRTYGAFARDPLYNNLQKRAVDVSATEKFLLSAEEIASMTISEISSVIDKEFAFDNFLWQEENHIRIPEGFRADGLNRVLYKCPACLAEGKMHGEGITLSCKACGKRYTLDEYGKMEAEDGVTEFAHIPDWFAWQRTSVRAEVLADIYSLDIPVEILMTVSDCKLYRVGEGRLKHTTNGFVLEGCDGKLHYEQKILASHSLNSDFNWYEIGDMISIGNNEHLFYCFPKEEGDIVAKTRLAAEEMYKIVRTKNKKTVDETPSEPKHT